jgi:hypothetical protein
MTSTLAPATVPPPPIAAAGPLVLREVITSDDELRAAVGPPTERVIKKALPALDAHCRAFIARSPFLLIGTSDASGACDVSPKGDPPGFVLVHDDRTLVIPDRPGNRRVDSLGNILQNPHVGLLFVIPGMDETLRVNGTAHILRDPALLERLAVNGKPAQLAIVVHVQQCFLHCGKSFLRARLWDSAVFIDRPTFPTLGEMIEDQIRPAERTDDEHQRVVAEAHDRVRDAYARLY